MNISHPRLNHTRSGRRQASRAPALKDLSGRAAFKSGVLVSCALAGAAICLSSSSVAQSARPHTAGMSRIDVQKLVHNMAWNQLSALRRLARHYQYTQLETKPEGSETTLEIETSQGVVGRLIEVNGAPPAEKRCRRERSRLARLARSSRARQSAFEQQQADLRRREALFEVLPKAFRYRFDGIEKNTGWIRLKYAPNPAFTPRSTVGGILQGLEGTLWVDPATQRLAKIDGHLVKAVTIGWGILAKLNPGGHFVMEQSKLPDGTWQLTMLDVDFHGTMLLLKRLNIHMKDSLGSYKEVEYHLTVPQAIVMLDRTPVHCSK